MVAATFPAAAPRLISRISRSAVSHRTNGVVGCGITSGRGLGTGVGDGVLTVVPVGVGEVWITGVGLERAATGGTAPVVQAASRAIAKTPESSFEGLMSGQRWRSSHRYAIR